MALPILVCGGTEAARTKGLDLKPNPDLMVLESDTAIKISQVRSLQNFLQKRPYQNPEKTAIISHAEKLTLPAQHALLKTLEEPPANSKIILLCGNINQLLPTIISRCLIKHLPQIKPEPGVVRKPPPDAFTNSTTAKDFVIKQLSNLQYELRRHPETVNLRLIRALNLAYAALTANVNPKLTLDVLSLSY